MLTSTARRSINQQRQQQINRSLVINLLRRCGVCSRAELAKRSGLQPATLTNIVGEFIDYGIVVEEGLLSGDKGRRAIGIRINGARFHVLGVMVMRMNYHIIDMGLSGEIFDVSTFPFQEHTDATELIQDICKNLSQRILNSEETQTLAIGFAIPGPYMEKAGRPVFVTNLSGWDSIPLYEILQAEFDVPVFVENDANAGVLGQLWFREEEALSDDLIYVVAGQGIGCGIFMEGELLKGDFGIAGEIGHTTIQYDGPPCECGNRGCLEKFCSTLALRERLQKRMNPATALPARTITMEDIAAAIHAGNDIVREEYIRACNLLAIGIVNLVNQLNPSTVIIGDELAAVAPELMLSTVRKRVQELVRPTVWEHLSIEVSRLPYNAILMGAGVVAIQKVFEDPFAYVKAEEPVLLQKV